MPALLGGRLTVPNQVFISALFSSHLLLTSPGLIQGAPEKSAAAALSCLTPNVCSSSEIRITVMLTSHWFYSPALDSS